MKRFLLLTLLSPILLALTASAYVPMIREDRVWEYVGPDWASLPEQHTAFHYVKFDGTVYANEHEYHRLVIFKTKRYTAPIGSDGSVDWSICQLIAEKKRDDVIALLREENGKVFRLMYDNGCIAPDTETVTGLDYTEDLIYDWTLDDGETFTVKRTPNEVDKTDITVSYGNPVNIGGETCRVMETGLLDVRFIEGIGPDRSGSVGEYWLDKILSLVYDNSWRPWLGSALNRVFDGEGNVIYQDENMVTPPAPTYVPMIREDRVWEYVGPYQAMFGAGYAFHYMKFDGTQDVNGTEYHRFVLFKSIYESYGELVNEESREEPYYLLREEEGKVFVLCTDGYIASNYRPGDADSNNDFEEFKVYDFSVNEGSVWEYPMAAADIGINHNCSPMTVRYGSPIDVEGEKCRVMSFNGFKPEFIEGLGVTFNGSLPKFNADICPGLGNCTVEPAHDALLNRVFDADGNVIYQYETPLLPPTNSVDGIRDDVNLTMSWKDNEVSAASDSDAMVTIEVVGIDGAKRMGAAGRGAATADLSTLATGVYVVRATDGHDVKTLKVMINDK